MSWVEGDATQLDTTEADLAIMTGHVAQFFLTDEGWLVALEALRDALRGDGRLAFESRNPGAREWERSTRQTSRLVDDPTEGRVEVLTEVCDVGEGIVTFANHYVFAATGEELVSPQKLRFLTQDELTLSLAEAGFAIEQMYGDWDRRPVGPTTPELIVVASR